MNLVFLGLFYLEDTIETVKKNSKTGLQMAPHTFQTTLIKGFEELDEIDLQVFNVPPVGSFPMHYNKMIVDSMYSNEKYRQIGYINVPVLKWVVQKIKLIHEIKKIIKKNGENEVKIVVYHTYIPFLRAINYLKKKYNNIKICLIATDCVPGREDMDKYMTKRAIKEGNKIVKLVKSVDCFALLTKHLVNPLEIDKKPYVITECICDSKQIINQRINKTKNICLYTGSIDVEFGICELANAFCCIENAELWICGNGSGKEYIQNLVDKYHNIKYFGFVNKEELNELRDSCAFLINPRKPTGTYTKYSFPSKTAEYMMSEKPIIMYKLEGIPDEYDQFLNYLKSNDTEKVIEELNLIFNEDYDFLLEKAHKGRTYMLMNTIAPIQAKKIVDMMEMLD